MSHSKTNRKIDPGREFLMHCPGCKTDHVILIDAEPHPCWKLHGSIQNPTFTPDFVYHTPGNVCHFIITDNVIHFGATCTHDKAGRSIRLEALRER